MLIAVTKGKVQQIVELLLGGANPFQFLFALTEFQCTVGSTPYCSG